jgi:hypothetical protein
MENFSKEINEFKQTGNYTYNPDVAGNYIFNSSSVNFNEVYIAFPIENFTYNMQKITSLYDINFTEFVNSTTSNNSDSNTSVQEINILKEENKNLKLQLTNLESNNTIAETESEKLSKKQVILELRKKLGEGKVDSDFSEDFPYTPILKENN